MKIISFSGVDGSGKSTQRELLQKYLEEHGHKTVYFHSTEFSLANRFQRKNKTFIPGDAPAITKASFFSVLARLVFLAIDGIRFHSYAAHLHKGGITVMVSDRFFQDSLINTAYLSKNWFLRAIMQFLGNALPIPEYSFYLQLTAEDILARARVPEQGLEYLRSKIALYDHPPFCWHTHTLDATHSPGSIHLEVVGKLGTI